MKAGRYCFILVVFAGFLYVPVIGEVEAVPAESEPKLTGQPDPALVGVKQLYVVIPAADAGPNSHGLVFDELENSITNKLKEAGIAITEINVDEKEPNTPQTKMARVLRRRAGYTDVKDLEFRHPRVPELLVYIDVLDVKDSQQVVFRVQMSLVRLVYLNRDRRPGFKTDVWRSEPTMQVTSAENMPVAVTSAVVEQSEAFIQAYLAANHPNKRSSDANLPGITPAKTEDVSVVPEEQIKPAAESTPAGYEYVTSKNSKVFHKPDCMSAKRIKPENLVGYSSRDEAIEAGKKPCELCNP